MNVSHQATKKHDANLIAGDRNTTPPISLAFECQAIELSGIIHDDGFSDLDFKPHLAQLRPGELQFCATVNGTVARSSHCYENLEGPK